MKVKIGNNTYDSNELPIMIIMNKTEKKLISEMSDDNNKFCSFPEYLKKDEIEEFMKGQ